MYSDISGGSFLQNPSKISRNNINCRHKSILFMEIKSLSSTPLEPIVDCLIESFAGYFVEMPSNVDYTLQYSCLKRSQTNNNDHNT